LTSDDVTACLARLADAERHLLRHLARSGAPRVPGIYALWHADELLYIGIARKDPADTTNPQAAGITGRLDTCRRARLTSDFTVAVAFRFIVPELSDDQRARLTNGSLTVRDVQATVKGWIATNVEFSTDAVTAPIAAAAEAHARRHGLPGADPPSFNRLG
jgi:hypothetical protein